VRRRKSNTNAYLKEIGKTVRHEEETSPQIHRASCLFLPSLWLSKCCSRFAAISQPSDCTFAAERLHFRSRAAASSQPSGCDFAAKRLRSPETGFSREELEQRIIKQLSQGHGNRRGAITSDQVFPELLFHARIPSFIRDFDMFSSIITGCVCMLDIPRKQFCYVKPDGLFLCGYSVEDALKKMLLEKD
jgi:hypothetical protein